jgi:hypothetical protein
MGGIKEVAKTKEICPHSRKWSSKIMGKITSGIKS